VAGIYDGEMTSSGVIVISSRPQGVVLAEGGVMVGIHLAPIKGERLLELRRGVEALGQENPRGVVSLGCVRLSRRFPLEPGFDDNVADLASTLRALDRCLVACANLVEFGGLQGAAFRFAVKAVCAIARPRAAVENFTRLSDAIVWMIPRAERAGLRVDSAQIVRLYREADRRLQAMDPGQAKGASAA
jgi:hypothetical protein